MIIPIRCFTCNEVIAHKWEEYINELQKAYLEEDIKNNYVPKWLKIIEPLNSKIPEIKNNNEMNKNAS
jgi:hypothetical protein